MLEDRIAIVTGSGRGIGRAIALRLAQQGAKIVVTDLVLSSAEGVVGEIKGRGGEGIASEADVSQSPDVSRLVETAVSTYGKVDILVNNAGITRDRLLVQLSDSDWDQVLSINLKGAFLCTREVLRHMMRQRWGRIVNIASIVALIGNAGQANYAAAKAGLVALTKTTAKEVASRGITANALAPGLGYLGLDEDVAQAVAFFASEEARYITGQVLNVDGGMTMV
jgi:3-oxoacyl-[acyl-carrier protein] reductase